MQGRFVKHRVLLLEPGYDSGDSPVASAFACLTKPLSLGMLLETLEAAARSGGTGSDKARGA